MSRSVRPWLKNTLLVLGGVGLVAIGWVGLDQILRSKPFAQYSLTGKPVGAEVGVTMTGFKMKAYEHDRLTAEAEMDTVEVRRDRSQMILTGVRNGKFFPKDGEPFSFDAKSGTYHYFQNRFMADDGAHVVNKEMDLESDKFVYEEASKTLLVRGSVQGMLAGGHVKASDLSLVTTTKELSANNVTWIGQIDELSQDGQRKEWKLGPGNMKLSADGKTQTWTPGRATDGEVIVIADQVDYTKDSDTLVAKSNVKYFGVDANMLCDEATVFRKERRAIFTGVVRMVVKAEDDEKVVEAEFPTIERVTPESLKTNPQGATQAQVDLLRDSDNMRKYPIKVLADKVEYWYKKGERRAVITGSPFARQDLTEGWRLGWSLDALYDGEKETLTLRSAAGKQDVKLFYSIGDQYVAADITMSTKEGDKSMSGNNVNATLFIDDDEVPTKTGGGSSTGGATTGGGTTGGGTTGGGTTGGGR